MRRKMYATAMTAMLVTGTLRTAGMPAATTADMPAMAIA